MLTLKRAAHILLKDSSAWRYMHLLSPLQEYPYIEVREKFGVREIVLNDEKTRNSLSMAMMNAIHCRINENINDVELRCIILSAKGKVWSAGHNLKELNSLDSKGQYDIFQRLVDIITSIQTAPVPVIAKVNGYAAAAGCQLCASCDIVLCSNQSKFSTPGADVGIFCTTPGIAISRIMPRTKSAYMLMTGLPISGNEAYIAGLATKAVPEAQLDTEVQKTVDAIKLKSRAVIAFGKAFYYKQLQMPLNEAYANGSQKMVENLGLADCTEGISGFIEKRAPKWQHK